MKIVGVGQLAAGLLMIITGLILARDGAHPLLAWLNLGLGFFTLYGSVKNIPPPSDGALAEIRS